MNSRTFDDGLHELSIALTERVYLKNPLGGGGEKEYILLVPERRN